MRGGFEMTSTFMQGGLPRHLGGYQNQIMEPSSPGQAWQYQSIIPKQEPLDEEKNDSGINSGSDFQTSSPGSDNSYHQSPIIPQLNQFYSTPGDGRIPYHMATQNMPPTHLLQQNIHTITQNMQQNMFNNPLTPPSLDNTLMSPRGEGNVDGDHTLTPAASPNASRSDEGQLDALKRLQSTLEKNGLLSSGVEQPAMSPSEGDMDSKSETNGDDLDEQGLRVPKINSHGKVKTFKCKQCNFVAITKLDFWEHNKAHIKAEKLLTCPKCPFVTELKHHLEYHILNHIGSKPFKCTKCSYSCVNKSMLNSHLKSHSNVYQYRCENCSYATKYCHSLKLHLRKYKHTPAMVLNPDGSPNPLPIIDVYGTRRGPKLKQNSTSGSDDEAGPSAQPQILPQMIPYQLQQLMMNPPQLPFGYPPFFPAGVLMQNLEKLARANAQPESPQSPREEQTEDSNGALDLSKEGTDTQVKNRRKGRAFKLNNLAASSSDEEDETTTMFSNVEVVDDTSNNNNNSKSPSSTTEDYSCPHCEINFNGDAVIYTMHMGYHGWKSPFTCNMCGEACKDKREFFSHIARSPHN